MREFLLSRRRFLFGALAAPLVANAALSADKIYKAAVIGRTGRGDYGHGFDTIFEGLPNVSVGGIADENADGLEKAALRAKAKRKYRDFREMLEKERPQLVSLAPRHPDCHKEMALASIAIGAHCIIEKPFTEHLNEADDIVRAAQEKGVRMVVGHKNRYSPMFQKMQRLIQEKFFGEILEMRVQGKQDHRAGGEDLIVLGTHDFDTMRFFFGDPISCTAAVTAKGKAITKDDVRSGREPMRVAGDTVRARFEFSDNVSGTWQSVSRGGDWNVLPRGAERWGFHIFGTNEFSPTTQVLSRSITTRHSSGTKRFARIGKSYPILRIGRRSNITPISRSI